MNFTRKRGFLYKFSFNRTFNHFSAGIILGFGPESSIEILSVYSSALWKFFRWRK